MSAAHERRGPADASRSGALGSLGLILAAAALLLAGVNWYRLRQAESDAAALQQQLTALQQNSASKDQLATDAADTQNTFKSLAARVDSVDSSLNELRQHSQEGRDAWIKAEAASLLMDANEKIALDADPVLALKALEQADARLKLLPDPRLIAVRQEIARESAALHVLPAVDREGMALTLTELAASVDKLPMKRTAPDHYQPGGDLDAPLPADAGFWERFKAAVARLAATLFTVRRHEMTVEPLLAPDQEFMLRRNLELKLESARSALLEREGEAFQAGTAAASSWLKDYFETRDNAVKAAVQQLDDMQQQQIAPKLPDVSRSLLMLRQLESAKDAAP